MRTHASRHARARLAVVGVGLLLALTACAPNGGAEAELDSGNTDAAFEEWSADFTSCMKEQGVDVQITQAGSGGSGSGTSSSSSSSISGAPDAGEADPDAMADANRLCIDKVGEPPVQESTVDLAEMNEASLRFAACMRELGYDFPDPEISDDGAATMTEAISTDEFDVADMDACSEKADFPEPDEK